MEDVISVHNIGQCCESIWSASNIHKCNGCLQVNIT